jgi:hypothetical protein
VSCCDSRADPAIVFDADPGWANACIAYSVILFCYDKQTKAINFRPLDPKIQLKILELKDAISRRQIDVASFNSRILS